MCVNGYCRSENGLAYIFSLLHDCTWPSSAYSVEYVLLKIKVDIGLYSYIGLRPSSHKNKGEHTPLFRWVYATLKIDR
jgi:hypothetical protein